MSGDPMIFGLVAIVLTTAFSAYMSALLATRERLSVELTERSRRLEFIASHTTVQPKPRGCTHPKREIVTLSLTGEAVGAVCADVNCMASIPPSEAFL